MSDFMQIILERRSVRQFEAREVPEDLLEQVLEAARWAQSWANTQCWEIIVIRDQAVKEAVQQSVPEGNPSLRSIVSAPVLLVLCGKLKASGYYKGVATTRFGDWFMFDLGIVTQNIALAAHALGLGTVVLGLFDQDRAREVLAVPEGYELVSLMPLGFPAGESKAPPRRAISEFTHYERF